MWFTMEDFQRQYAREHFKKLTSAECRERPGVAGTGRWSAAPINGMQLAGPA
jgi:hypothetical protein